jgi:periplasmic protein TonB
VTPRFGLPLAASLVGHGALLLVLVFLMARLPPMPPPLRFPNGGIEVLLTRPSASVPVPPAPPAAPPPEPPQPVVQTAPPRPSPAIKPARPAPSPPRRAAPARRLPPTAEPAPERPSLPAAPVAPPSPAPTMAPAPRAPAAPAVSPGYRAALSAWLERHKQYPEGARARGEEGQAVLRFRVDRSGRVLGYSIVRGTGYPDLDGAVDRMMRGAMLPPFPADMTAAEIDVSVPLRFALSR